MKNITNKELQRMLSLMGNKTPINENKTSQSVDLVKKSADGKFYAIVKENKKYFIKESTDGTNFDFIGGIGNKTKNQYSSYEEATRRLNIMFESINRANGIDSSVNILVDDLIQEKKYVIKSKKTSEPTPEPAKEPEATGFDFGGADEGGKEEPAKEGGDEEFDFGDGETGDQGNFGDEETGDKGDFGDEETGDQGFDFGDEETSPESGDTEFGGEDIGSEDDLGDEEDSIKSIQRITGKLGQKLRDTEDLSSDTMKWVAKSVLSALHLNQMDTDDKKDLIRTIKKKGGEGEEDFMDEKPMFSSKILTYADLNMSRPQPSEDDEWHPDQSFMSEPDEDDNWHPDQSFMSDWSKMTKEEKSKLIKQREDNPNIGGDEDDENLLFDDYMAEPQIAPAEPTTKPGTKEKEPATPPSKKPFTPPPFIKPGEESAPKAEDEDYGTTEAMDYMDKCYMNECGESYMEGNPTNKEVYDNGDVVEYQTIKDVDGGLMKGGYQMSEYIIQYNGEVYFVPVYNDGNNQDVMNPEKKASTEGVDIQNVDYMDDENFIMCHVCDGVGSMRLDYNYPDESCSTCDGYGMIKRDEVNGETDEPFVLDPGMDYMDDKYYMSEPQIAPAEPTTKPGTKEPATTPSKRPFTPPPFIKPGEESAPKARREIR